MFILCHYGEIALKGKNRKYFEERLVDNIKKALPKGSFRRVQRISGRILIELAERADRKQASEVLEKVFGLVYFAFVLECPAEIEVIKTKAVALLQTCRGRTSPSFKVSCRRADKAFPLTSQQVNEQVGEAILKKCRIANEKCQIRVDLENPGITLFIEIVEGRAFLYAEKIRGLGGLPVGVSGKAVCLLSGGIDSPVASCLAMKMGLKVVFLHLDNTKGKSSEKAEKLVNTLSQYQEESRLCLIPFSKIQKEIFKKADPELACLLCKRMMMRLANEIARKEKAGAVITGENLGQVASQTLPNMAVIEEAAGLPVLKPLLTFDKQETILLAKKIKTYDISILPERPFCQALLAAHPATKAVLSQVKKEEKKLAVDKLIKEALNSKKELWLKK